MTADVDPPAYTNPIPFSAGVPLEQRHADLVANFVCGRPGQPESPFEHDVTRWISDRGPGGAWEAIVFNEAEVRLYLDPTGRLIGYGALGRETWPMADGGDVTLWLLLYFRVHSDYRHQPNVPRQERYGRRILGGLVEEVEQRGVHRYFGLYVDPANPARVLYEEFGFRELDVWPDPDDGGRPWVRMVRRLGGAGS